MRNKCRGVILIEVLVALSIFSLLALSALSLIGNVTAITNQPIHTKLYTLVETLHENPSAHVLKSNIRLLSEKRYADGSVWRVYSIRPDGSKKSVRFPVYYPDMKQ